MEDVLVFFLAEVLVEGFFFAVEEEDVFRLDVVVPVFFLTAEVVDVLRFDVPACVFFKRILGICC